MEFTIPPFLAKLVLRFNPFNRIMDMCRGYSEDYRNFTELVWDDDKHLDFFDKASYPQFQLWLHRHNGTGILEFSDLIIPSERSDEGIQK